MNKKFMTSNILIEDDLQKHICFFFFFFFFFSFRLEWKLTRGILIIISWVVSVDVQILPSTMHYKNGLETYSKE